MTAADTNSSEVFFLTPAASDSVISGRGQLGRMQIWAHEPKFVTEKLLLIALGLAAENCKDSTPLRAVKKSIIAAFAVLKHKKSFLKEQRHDLCHLQLMRHLEHRPSLLKTPVREDAIGDSQTLCLHVKCEIECFSSRSDQLLAFVWQNL